MTDVDELLPQAFTDLGRQAPHDPDLAGAVRRRSRRQTRRLAAVAASVVGVLAVASLSVALSTRGGGSVPAAGAGPDPVAPVSCSVDGGVLPTWAWTGFSEPNPRVAHVLGDRGDIVAILFAQPLYAPTAPADRNNKVLWVGRVADAGDLVIDASLPGTGQRVTRVVTGGPGPSTIDLPVPGCWRLDLRWGPYTDTVALNYVAAG